MSTRTDSLGGPISLIAGGLVSCYIAGYALQQGITSPAAVAALTAIGVWSLLLALMATTQLLTRIDRRCGPAPRRR